MKIRINPSLNRIHPVFWQLVVFAVSLSSFTLILLNRKPGFLRDISIAARIDFLPIIPILAILVYMCFRLPGRIGELIAFTATMILFALPLAGLWASGHTHTTALSGLIPLGDAKIYYSDALRLSSGMDFSDFSARRPLFTGFLAVLLSLTHYNLMASLAIFTAINGFAAYLTTKELQRTHGNEVSVFVLIIIFLFYRLHSGTSMTENLGLALGLLGFIFLWRGAFDRKLWLVWVGLFVTTLALNARAGAFFILPFLIIWSGMTFHRAKQGSWKAISLSLLALIFGFTVNLGFTHLVSKPTGVPFANFSYSLYGLASGGKSWFYVYEVHPEIFALSEPEHSRRVYQLAFELIRDNPGQLIKGAIFNWKMLLSDNLYSLYSYVAHENWNINPLIRWTLYILSIFGLYNCLKDIKTPIHSLIVAGALGIFLSAPFAPPIDTFRLRQFAASVVFLALIPAIGFGFLLQLIKRDLYLHPKTIEDPFPISIIFTALIILTSFAGPLIIKHSVSEKVYKFSSCPSGLAAIVIRFDQGTFINIQENNRDYPNGMPNFPIKLFQKEAHSISDGNMINWLQHIPPATTLFMTLNRNNQSSVLVTMPTNMMPNPGQYVQLCGKYEEDPGLEFFKNIFITEKRMNINP